MNESPKEKDAQRRNSERLDEAITFRCGVNGSIIIHPTIPAPEQSAQDAAQADKRPSWMRTMRRDGIARWQTNVRRSA
jgi:hypothetical protein